MADGFSTLPLSTRPQPTSQDLLALVERMRAQRAAIGGPTAADQTQAEQVAEELVEEPEGFIARGGALGGGIAGAVVGGFTAGPLGAIAGGVAGAVAGSLGAPTGLQVGTGLGVDNPVGRMALDIILDPVTWVPTLTGPTALGRALAARQGIQATARQGSAIRQAIIASKSSGKKRLDDLYEAVVQITKARENPAIAAGVRSALERGDIKKAQQLIRVLSEGQLDDATKALLPSKEDLQALVRIVDLEEQLGTQLPGALAKTLAERATQKQRALLQVPTRLRRETPSLTSPLGLRVAETKELVKGESFFKFVDEMRAKVDRALNRIPGMKRPELGAAGKVSAKDSAGAQVAEELAAESANLAPGESIVREGVDLKAEAVMAGMKTMPKTPESMVDDFLEPLGGVEQVRPSVVDDAIKQMPEGPIKRRAMRDATRQQVFMFGREAIPQKVEPEVFEEIVPTDIGGQQIMKFKRVRPGVEVKGSLPVSPSPIAQAADGPTIVTTPEETALADEAILRQHAETVEQMRQEFPDPPPSELAPAQTIIVRPQPGALIAGYPADVFHKTTVKQRMGMRLRELGGEPMTQDEEILAAMIEDLEEKAGAGHMIFHGPDAGSIERALPRMSVAPQGTPPVAVPSQEIPQLQPGGRMRRSDFLEERGTKLKARMTAHDAAFQFVARQIESTLAAPPGRSLSDDEAAQLLQRFGSSERNHPLGKVYIVSSSGSKGIPRPYIRATQAEKVRRNVQKTYPDVKTLVVPVKSAPGEPGNYAVVVDPNPEAVRAQLAKSAELKTRELKGRLPAKGQRAADARIEAAAEAVERSRRTETAGAAQVDVAPERAGVVTSEARPLEPRAAKKFIDSLARGKSAIMSVEDATQLANNPTPANILDAAGRLAAGGNAQAARNTVRLAEEVGVRVFGSVDAFPPAFTQAMDALMDRIIELEGGL